MSRHAWNLKKTAKIFNVSVYRKGLTLIILSLLLSFALTGMIFYIYKHLPERDYYATSGIAPPVKLTFMWTPNMTAEALLPPDPEDVDEYRTVPP